MWRAAAKSSCAWPTARSPIVCPSAIRSRKNRTSLLPTSGGAALRPRQRSRARKLARAAPGARVFCRHPRRLRRRRVAVVAEIRLRTRHGGRIAAPSPRSRPRPLRDLVPRRLAADRSRAMGRRRRHRGADVLGARRSRYRSAHGQYRRRLSGALPRGGGRGRTLCPGRDGGDHAPFRQPLAGNHR